METHVSIKEMEEITKGKDKSTLITHENVNLLFFQATGLSDDKQQSEKIYIIMIHQGYSS